MEAAAIQALLALLEQFVPGATGAAVKVIIDAIVALVPLIIRWATDATPRVKAIIAALKGNGDITPELMDQLDQADAALDAGSDAASAAADAEDNAASS